MKRLIALLAAAGLTGPSFALGLTDHDGDGRISRAEFADAIARIALTADVNGDAVIEHDEFAWTAASLSLFDNDGDGRITSVGIREFQDGLALAFDALDRDGDGYLDPAEAEGAIRYGIASNLGAIKSS